MTIISVVTRKLVVLTLSAAAGRVQYQDGFDSILMHILLVKAYQTIHNQETNGHITRKLQCHTCIKQQSSKLAKSVEHIQVTVLSICLASQARLLSCWL